MRRSSFGETAGEPPQQHAEQGQADRAERHQADLHLVPAHALAEHRAQTDPQREHGENQRHHALVAVQPLLGVGRNLRQVDRAEKPEPGVAHQRARHRRTLAQAELHDHPGLTEDIPVQRQFRHGSRRLGNAQAGQVAEQRHADHRTGDDGRIAAAGHHDAGADGAGQNRQEGAHFHQGVTAHQLLLLEVLRQDRILHRTEQRRLRAHGEQHGEHQRQVVQQHPGGAGKHDADLGELDLADQRVLGELLAKLAAEGREQKERQDEQQGAEIDQQIAVDARVELEEDGENQRLLEDVVVEGAEQLRHEKRQKALLAEQGELRLLGHRPWSSRESVFARTGI